MAYDTSLYVNRLTERAILGPVGNGRVVLPGDFFQNGFDFSTSRLSSAEVAGLLQLANTVRPVNPAAAAGITTLIGINPLINPALGARLNAATLQQVPTKLTTAQALQLLAVQGSGLQGLLNQAGAAGVIGADFFKTITGNSVLIDPDIELPYSTSISVGVQRELPMNMALSVDFVSRRYLHSFFQRDRAMFNRAPSLGGPMLPVCSPAQATNPAVRCLNGPFEVIEGSGREDYKALLVKLEKRFSNRYQFTGSYALSRLRGFDYDRDLNDPFAFRGFGNGDRLHRFTLSGVADLPLGLRAGLIVSFESGAPFSATIPGTTESDLNGDGTNNDFLPGTGFNSINRDISVSDLRRLVDQYNTQFAGKPAPRGGQFPLLTLPSNIDSLGDSFQSYDVRLSKQFNIIAERLKLELIGELYNIFNISNRRDFSGSIDNGFAAPTNKANPIFGLGGPRIFQIGGRLTF
jgi:hypothetical protein